jgi:hypothetical protein
LSLGRVRLQRSASTPGKQQITQLRHETYEDEDAWPTMLDGQLRYLMDVPSTNRARRLPSRHADAAV